MSKIYIVGTPIGNLKDITLRALETLKNVDVIACEDTRTSSVLLNHYEINKKLITYHKMNEENSAKGIIEYIQKNNANVALICDAGMPLINDPGFALIKQARENNIEVELIPGVNAAISAFALSGLSSTFMYCGFPKEKSGQRLNQVKEFTQDNAYIFYVSPHKIVNFIQDIETVWNEQAQIFIANELTKLHEKTYWGTPKEILEKFKVIEPRGEYTLVIKLNKVKKEKINKYKNIAN